MKIYINADLTIEQRNKLLVRLAIDSQTTLQTVIPILDDIKVNGVEAAKKYAKKFDNFSGDNIRIEMNEFDEAEKSLPAKVKRAIDTAYENIYTFHLPQKPKSYEVETMPEVNCSREFRAIENVGLYIPGGRAVLPSTMLMLGVPAQIAGCTRVVVCSPSKENKINAPLLYAAKLCGIKEFYMLGGAQAIGLMAYGDKSIKKVDKIFGPGNQYVTAAKQLVSIDHSGCAIDMPAGPSEILIIIDEFANPAFTAADLLSQAEHGADSQVVLLSTSKKNVKEILKEILIQVEMLPRKESALSALNNSFAIIFDNLKDAINFSNDYAPEHLIMNFKDAHLYKNEIANAASVFIGEYSPESAGDYASGTNHSLPTYGYAKSFGGVTVESFMKSITFQNLTKEGLRFISETVEILAEVEGLQAHRNAVSIRLKD